MQTYPITPAGRERLRRELDHLKRVERPTIIQAIEVAREHGDLKENAEYHAAKERQGHIEGRIRELEGKVASATVIDPTSLKSSRVCFGATVTILDTDNYEKLRYAIVGEDEADFRKGLLSVQSPIAKSILGKEAGDDAVMRVENNVRNFEVLRIEFLPIDVENGVTLK